MPITPGKARNLLNDACTRYIAHNQEQLDQLLGKPNHPHSRVFFDAVFGIGKNPKPGFHDWFKCELFAMVDYWVCLSGGNEEAGLYGLRDQLQDEVHVDGVVGYIMGLNRRLSQLLNYPKSESAALYQQVKHAQLYHENLYDHPYGAPASTRLYLELQQLDSLSRLVQAVASHHLSDPEHRLIRLIEPQEGIDDIHYAKNAVCNANAFCQRLEASKSIFDGYLKGLVVKELRERLPSDNDEWVEDFNSLYTRFHTQDILKTNRESKCEYLLKLLSVISILVGVGIFTTIALSSKRFHDTNGKSINFFKPLSATLNEGIGGITAQILAA